METSKLTTPTLYKTSFFTDDIMTSVKYLKDYFNNPNFYTIGMSMGSGIILKCSG